MPSLLLALLCDDVRIENNGKQILIGLFDKFNVVDFARPLPTFHIFMKVGLESPTPVEMVIRIASLQGDFGSTLSGQLQPDQNLDAATERYVATIDLSINGIRVPRPGRYYVAITIGTTELQAVSFFVAPITPPTVQ